MTKDPNISIKNTTIQAQKPSRNHVLENVKTDFKEFKKDKSVKNKVKKMFTGKNKIKTEISRVSSRFTNDLQVFYT